MLGKLTESKIAHFFYIIGIRERELEKLRENLSQNFDFDLYTAFKHLDLDNRNSISASDIQLFLYRHHINSDISLINLLISQYDINLDGRLSLNEFTKLIIPISNEYLPNSASLRTTLSGLSLEIQLLLLRLFKLELLFHEELEKMRNDIISQRDFSLLDSFRIIDYSGRSIIDRIVIKSLLSKYGHVLNEGEINGIFRRFDYDGDRAMNYVEYVGAIMPKMKKRRCSPLERESPYKTYTNNSHGGSSLEYASESCKGTLRRNSSPLRQASPQKTLYFEHSTGLSSPLRQNNLLSKEIYSANTTSLKNIDSPLRRYSPIHQASPLRRTSPLRQSSPLRSNSPLRKSPTISSKLNFSPNKNQTTGFTARIRTSPLRQNYSDSPAKILECCHLSPQRNSSPLRNSSPNLNNEPYFSSNLSHTQFSPLKTVDISPKRPSIRNSPTKNNYSIRNYEVDLIPQRQPPFKSIPLRNSSLRESPVKFQRESPTKSSPLKYSPIDCQYANLSKNTHFLRNSNF